jgi:hypothetical protein
MTRLLPNLRTVRIAWTSVCVLAAVLLGKIVWATR